MTSFEKNCFIEGFDFKLTFFQSNNPCDRSDNWLYCEQDNGF